MAVHSTDDPSLNVSHQKKFTIKLLVIITHTHVVLLTPRYTNCMFYFFQDVTIRGKKSAHTHPNIWKLQPIILFKKYQNIKRNAEVSCGYYKLLRCCSVNDIPRQVHQEIDFSTADSAQLSNMWTVRIVSFVPHNLRPKLNKDIHKT